MVLLLWGGVGYFELDPFVLQLCCKLFATQRSEISSDFTETVKISIRVEYGVFPARIDWIIFG
jgi:hypothetical protein